MTVTISKEFMMYFLLFIVITVFGLLYMTQSHYIYEQTTPGITEHVNEQNDVRIDTEQTIHDPVQNGEVLGVVN
ncbi:hypothetical protein ETI06_08115 [Macrococcoides goetzii]|nr:hypothetical protein [Macrococcus goetzii]TDM42304.1 hypothetical protein ETI10_04190 [Macrococcus goetzii]TDM47713.1 hypothetical protein ETI08_00850 [Macrococcus goetzii]TDM48984.1 hypothetical protein ETI06_08115 [Macrococcus goetzii]